VAVVSAAAALLNASVNASAQTGGVAEYRRFVSDPPFMKRVVFGQSGNLFTVYVQGHEPRSPVGFVLFRGAMQSDSWYLQTVANAPLGSKASSTGDGYTVGKTSAYYWGLSADRKTISKTPVSSKEGGGPKTLAGRGLLRINMVRRLGLIYLEPLQIPDVPSSITWIDESNFKGTTGSKGLMTGKIVEFTNGFPEQVRFQFSEIPNADFSVVYTYDHGRAFPPSRITGYKTTGGQTAELWEFVLDEIEIGSELAGFEGYTPQQFMSQDEVRSAEVVSVEGQRIVSKMPNGATIRRTPTVPDYDALQPELKKRSALVRVALLSLLIMGFVLVVYVARRHAS
jgi:hypothetical protein